MALRATDRQKLQDMMKDVDSGGRIFDTLNQLTDSSSTYTQTYDTADRTVAAPTATAPVALTDSTGLSGTHDDTLAATTVPSITASNPTAPAAYSAHASGSTPVTSNAATDLDTTAAALATLRGEVATYETAISALVVDVGAILTLLGVMVQNQSDVAQKVNELQTSVTALIADGLDNRQSITAIIDDLQEKGVAG